MNHSKEQAFSLLRKYFEERSPIPDSEWTAFAPGLLYKSVGKGKRWQEIGDSASGVGYVISGLFRAFYITLDGSDSTRYFRTGHSLIGAYSEALSGTPSNIAIEALDDSELVVFQYENFKKGYGRHPCWDVIARKVAEAHYIAYEKRGYQLLCLDAEERYRQFRADFPELAKILTQTQIASYLGITPVSLSRILGKKRGKNPE